ncbi:MAG: RNA pseudouridine synthase [Bacteroidaceae bacterium]|nr:RNA pseudouridine synthase [Bacteroidaceae bacterium]
MDVLPEYLHPLERETEPLPTSFTYPFRYEPHPLCRRAAAEVQGHLEAMGFTEAKMFGVLIVRDESGVGGNRLFFLAAYSGQMAGSYDYKWFVPPIYNYLDPQGYFMQEQAQIVGLSEQISALEDSEELKSAEARLALLSSAREKEVAGAKALYEEGRKRRETLRNASEISEAQLLALTLESQKERADIRRAKQKYKDEIILLEEEIRDLHRRLNELCSQRKERSERLQDWLFRQFRLLNGEGDIQDVVKIFHSEGRRLIPSGTGECCAPKLLQTAYMLNLKPLCIAEFWWNPLHLPSGNAEESRMHLEFYPACHSKCRPLLNFMLKGLDVAPSPVLHYNKVSTQIRVLWEDEQIAIVDKPSGMLSQPGRSDQPNLFDECLGLWPDIEGQVIVHRLDQDTSGIMVVAKTSRAHYRMRKLFELRQVEKEYEALLDGRLSMSEGTINLPLAPDIDSSPRQKVDYNSGLEAVTEYRVIGFEAIGNKPITRIRFRPLTGRTHQLRVHAASSLGLNLPILGDRLYGTWADRLYLHAASLSFTHPFTNEKICLESQVPF